MSQYQVLARKYRPKKLSELVGQEMLVRTLSNAIEQNRLPHAFILTGIRGIGKTSTARIIARSLLCTGDLGQGLNSTVEPCGVCMNCQGISNDNHVDVIEVDAASRTGVDNIREIIEQVNYAPVMGRFKIYIIDEVHMLSKGAFNALLKTLEEPPQHVKFIFATTEIRKIPVTILSRCMRFDLPRVSATKLVEHFKNIAAKETVEVDEEALRIIAGVSEGSVRDGLSLLDQAIAICSGEKVSAEKVREMLGLFDKEKTFSLLSLIIDGNSQEALKKLNEIYSQGTDPILIIKDMLEITHLLTLATVGEEILKQNHISEMERVRSSDILKRVDLAGLTRLWQVINKAIEEARFCPSPLMAAEMAVIRGCYACSLPTPQQILQKLEGKPEREIEEPNLFVEKKTLNSPPITRTEPPQPKPALYSNNSAVAVATAQVAQPVMSAVPVKKHDTVPHDFMGLIEFFENKKENLIAAKLKDVKLIKYEPENGAIEIIPNKTLNNTDIQEITKKLFEWTGKRFVFSLVNTAGENAKSINDERQEALEKRKSQAINSQAVQSILNEFKGAEILEVKEIFDNMSS